jgi:hypothetical protein
MNQGPDLSVNRSDLITQAKEWDANGSQLGIHGRQAAGSRIPVAGAVLFTAVVEAYDQVCEQVATWCGEGDTQMQAISEAVMAAHGRYDTAEGQNERSASSAVSALPSISSIINRS